MKKEYFYTELNRIKDENIRRSTEYVLDYMPEYFYQIPACNSGKYHPLFAQGEQGLVRHTKAAAKILEDLLENEAIAVYTDRQKDLLRMAILLHDGFKSGIEYSGHTDPEHPLIMSRFLWQHKDELDMPREDVCYVCGLIESHMGLWNTNDKDEEILPIPKTTEQLLIHLSDYIVSRNYLDIKFVDNEIIDIRRSGTQPVLKQD